MCDIAKREGNIIFLCPIGPSAEDLKIRQVTVPEPVFCQIHNEPHVVHRDGTTYCENCVEVALIKEQKSAWKHYVRFEGYLKSGEESESFHNLMHLCMRVYECTIEMAFLRFIVIRALRFRQEVIDLVNSFHRPTTFEMIL